MISIGSCSRCRGVLYAKSVTLPNGELAVRKEPHVCPEWERCDACGASWAPNDPRIHNCASYLADRLAASEEKIEHLTEKIEDLIRHFRRLGDD